MQLSNLASPIPSFSIGILTSLLDEAGIGADNILEEAGLTRAALANPAQMVDCAQELGVLRAFALATKGRPDLWIAAGSRYRTFTFYPLGFAQITAPTLRDALALTRRFSKLHYGLWQLQDIEDDADNVGIALSYEPAVNDMIDFLRCRDAIALTNWFHDLWGGQFPFSRIETSSEEPARGGFNYRAPVTLSVQSRWMWPRAVMAQPPAHADAAVHKLYVAASEAMATAPAAQPANAPDAGDDPLIHRIMEVMEVLEPAEWNLDRTAKALSMSRRGLQRRLMQRGISFRALIDVSRRRTAKRLLKADQMPVAEIAWHLGYSDSSSFHRAFIRWTGVSPRRYRRDSMAPTAPAGGLGA